jgi:hypothetical protein
MHETTTKQQMKNENKSDGEHDDVDVNSDKTNYEIVHDEIKNNKPTRASNDINTNSKINKDLRQLDDQAHKHNTENPTHETPTRYQQQTLKPKDDGKILPDQPLPKDRQIEENHKLETNDRRRGKQRRTQDGRRRLAHNGWHSKQD